MPQLSVHERLNEIITNATTKGIYKVFLSINDVHLFTPFDISWINPQPLSVGLVSHIDTEYMIDDTIVLVAKSPQDLTIPEIYNYLLYIIGSDIKTIINQPIKLRLLAYPNKVYIHPKIRFHTPYKNSYGLDLLTSLEPKEKAAIMIADLNTIHAKTIVEFHALMQKIQTYWNAHVYEIDK